RDYGQLAWWIFAVPNCIGAAAMGWALRTAEDSSAYVRRHAAACRLFSLVTIAFHLFFAVWMLPGFVGPAGWVVAVAAVQLAFTPVLKRTAAAAAVGVFAVSVVAASVMAYSGALTVPAMKAFSAGDLAGLSLVCLLGFFCSPYLDLTFHRARQSTSPAGGRLAFGAGFCLFFAAMIVLTLLYASRFTTLPAAAAWAMLVHMGLQICFTVNVHAATLADDTADSAATAEGGSGRTLLALALAIGLAAGTVGRLSPDVTSIGLTPGEILYRCFMAFYGLIAPAYVLVSLSRRRGRWAWVAVIAGIAAPAYWIAFVHRQMAIALIGGAVVLAGAALSFALRRRESPVTV
ncbi:MAG TPA: hypothetical protein VF624_13210, partial [Tepidisphaeraceae bacterium]